MPHAVLLGDSIFDNARYVPGEPCVAEQLQAALGEDWTVTLLAVDGDVTAGVARQLETLPAAATHLVVSCGGNDALGQLPLLKESASSVAGVLERLAAVRAGFADDYRRMLARALEEERPLAVCTVYDAIPGLERGAQTALALFNEIILREAVAAGVDVVDLRLVCPAPGDYSALSPIEPSARGGEKIAAALRGWLLAAPVAGRDVRVVR